MMTLGSRSSKDAVARSGGDVGAPDPCAGRLPLSGSLLMLFGALVALGLVFALLFRSPGTSALQATADLHAATLQVSVVLTELRHGQGGSRARLDAAAGLVEERLRRLQHEIERGSLHAPGLARLETGWRRVRGALGDATAVEASIASMRSQAALAQTLTEQVRDELDDRQDVLELGLKTLTLMLALALVVPIVNLWRQRQHMKTSLRQFSDDLGSGAWQEAVHNLREDRFGAPSAFDALATGVEGVLGESERRWRALADLSVDWYWETDRRHRVCWFAGSMPALGQLGWTTDDMMGRRRDQMPFYRPPPGGWDAFHERLDRHEPFRDIELEIVGPQASDPVWISISGRPRHDAHGLFVGYEGVGRDVTQRKLAHERLLASEQRWSTMTGLASDWYWQTDEQHRLLPLGKESRQRLGHALLDRAEGLTRWDAHPDALPPEQWAEHRADLEARRPFRSLQLEIEVEPGRFAWLSLSGVPRHDAQRSFLGYHGVGRDITARKQAERLLLRHNEELQRAVSERTRELEQVNLDLDAFARQLAHELRTPIGHVQGLAHLLEARAAERLSVEERQLIGLQLKAARGMRSTVDALLLLARSTLQPMPMQPVDLSALAAEVIAELPPLERVAPVQWQVQPGLRVLAAPAPLRIVLMNLLGNAAKFSRRVAAPQVRVGAAADADGGMRVHVEDNGAGFDPQRAGKLFSPFHRLHVGDEFGGTGLGLTIVQRIVERHGGRVSASGEPGRGARFEFTLPAADPAVAAGPRLSVERV